MYFKRNNVNISLRLVTWPSALGWRLLILYANRNALIIIACDNYVYFWDIDKVLDNRESFLHECVFLFVEKKK